MKIGLLINSCILLLLICARVYGVGASGATDYQLAAGDAIRITVFQHENLTLETRVTENGQITYPLVGSVALGGLTLAESGERIARALEIGGFVKNAQVNVVLLQVRGNQVSVLGHVNQPGRFPLETFNTRVSDVVAMAGGISPTGSDMVVVTGERNEKTFKKEIDFPALFTEGNHKDNILVRGGDVVYVARAPVFYIYGSVNRPGSYRIERNMTIQQALAQGGGASDKGVESGIRVYRKKSNGKIDDMKLDGAELVQPDDVLYVRESIF